MHGQLSRQDIRFRATFQLRSLWAPLLAAAVATFTTWVGVSYSDQPLLEHEAWRQTQTALTSYWMIQEGWQLAYQTPVLGYPWEIPLEFPIYQTIVALIVWLGGFPLDATGRIVSLLFLLACGWPAFQIARRLDLPSEAPWLFCALLWSAPVYIFYGRNFLMETAALFFVFAAVPYALDLRQRQPRLTSSIAFGLFATLSLLQKITTAFPILLGLVVILAGWHFRERGAQLPSRRDITYFVLSFGIPGTIALLWLLYAGHVRMNNYVMAGIHSNESMIESWFGGNQLRLNAEPLLLLFWERITLQNAAGVLGMAVLITGALVGSLRLRAIIAAGVFFCFLPSFMFIRHHHFLDYYQTANVLFLVGALAISAISIARYARSRIVASILVAAIVVVNLFNYSNGYGRLVQTALTPENDATLAVSDVVQRYTPTDSAIIVFGLMSRGSLRPISAWSSEVAYYSERKSLTVTNSLGDEIWSDPASFLGDKMLGAIVFCSRHKRKQHERILDKYGSELPPSLFRVGDCHVWLPGVSSIVLPSGETVNPTRSFE